MNKKIHIFHITTVNIMGGAEKKVINILKTHNKDFYYTVTHIRDLEGPLAKWVSQLDFGYVNLNQKSFIHKILHLNTLIRTNKFDVVHTFGITAECYGCMLAWYYSIPCISTLVGTKDYDSFFRKIIGRFVSKFVSQYVSVSKMGGDILHQVVHVPWHKINIIINGIEIIDPSGSRQDDQSTKNRFKILTTANLHPGKGHQYLFQAIKLLSNQGYNNMQFILAGRDDYHGKLQTMAEQLGIRDKVHFAGFQDNIYPLLNSCDLFVLPSEHEGVPISIIEAMAAGKPVIATNVGGIPEIIKNNETGLLIPAKNPRSISQAIQSLYHSKDKRDYLAKNAKFYSHRYLNKERMVQKYWDLYYKLCSK